MGAERQGAGQGCALCGCLDLVHSLNLRTCEDMCEDFGCFLEFPTPSHVRSVASRVAAEDSFHDQRHRQKLPVIVFKMDARKRKAYPIKSGRSQEELNNFWASEFHPKV